MHGMSSEERWLLEEKYKGEKTEGFFADLEKLNTGTPLAYLIGHIPFLNTTIYLDSHPLIPRAETEYWTKNVLEEIKVCPSPVILDLCAGSGCIGVAVAKEIQDSKVSFVEINAVHHDTILKNIDANSVDRARCRIYGGDLFECVHGKYDFILSNPPYIDKSLDRTQQSVIDHEPQEALYGGADGLEIVQRIIKDSPRYLAPFGKLFIEHEPEQTDAIHQLGTLVGYTVTTHNDQYNIPRYSVLRVAQ